jgi:hypothetical protein
VLVLVVVGALDEAPELLASGVDEHAAVVRAAQHARTAIKCRTCI